MYRDIPETIGSMNEDLQDRICCIDNPDTRCDTLEEMESLARNLMEIPFEGRVSLKFRHEKDIKQGNRFAVLDGGHQVGWIVKDIDGVAGQRPPDFPTDTGFSVPISANI